MHDPVPLNHYKYTLQQWTIRPAAAPFLFPCTQPKWIRSSHCRDFRISAQSFQAKRASLLLLLRLSPRSLISLLPRKPALHEIGQISQSDDVLHACNVGIAVGGEVLCIVEFDHDDRSLIIIMIVILLQVLCLVACRAGLGGVGDNACPVFPHLSA